MKWIVVALALAGVGLGVWLWTRPPLPASPGSLGTRSL